MTEAVKGKTVDEAARALRPVPPMMVTPSPDRYRDGPGQAGGARRRARVSDARQVREPGMAHAEGRDVETVSQRLEYGMSDNQFLPVQNFAKTARPTNKSVNRGHRSRSVKMAEIRPQVLEALGTVFDPEIPVNIREMGLIYDVLVDKDGRVGVRMTLTAPACPAAQSLPVEVREKAASCARRYRGQGGDRLGPPLDQGADVRGSEIAAWSMRPVGPT